jgi:hypothetical protein
MGNSSGEKYIGVLVDLAADVAKAGFEAVKWVEAPGNIIVRLSANITSLFGVLASIHLAASDLEKELRQRSLFNIQTQFIKLTLLKIRP